MTGKIHALAVPELSGNATVPMSRVRRDEPTVNTANGRPEARVGPLHASSWTGVSLDSLLQQAAEDITLIVAAVNPDELHVPVERVRLNDGELVSDLVIAERGPGWWCP